MNLLAHYIAAKDRDLADALSVDRDAKYLVRSLLAKKEPEPALQPFKDIVDADVDADRIDATARDGLLAGGDCWDNTVVESFFHTLKVERLHDRRYATQEQLYQDLEDYIERFYNRQRRHSTLGYVSPAMFELQHAA